MPQRLTDGIWRVDLDRVNVYLVETEAGPVTVDAGLPSDAPRIRSAMEEAGLDPDALAGVLVTHTDLDHVGGLAELVEGNDARVYASPAAADLLTGAKKPPWLNTKGLFQRVTSLWMTPPPADRIERVQEGDTTHGFRVVETPGHALGHLAFVDETRGICFVGDIVRTEDQIRLSPGLINYDSDQLADSLAHLLDTTKEIEMVCAGHGPPLLQGGRGALEGLRG